MRGLLPKMTPEQYAALRESQARVETLVEEGFRRVDDRLTVLDTRSNSHTDRISKLEHARYWFAGGLAALVAVLKLS